MDSGAALRQVQSVLSSSWFRSSKRSHAFLEYVSRQVLEGRLETLKERVIGVEVFGRKPGYNTNEDAIVRTTAGEVRKRLAQYYQEPGHDEEVRLDVPLGSYILQFHAPGQKSAIAAEELPEPKPAPASRRRWWLLLPAAAVLGLLIWAVLPADALTSFWSPVMDTPGPVLVCIGQPVVFNFSGVMEGPMEDKFGTPNWQEKYGNDLVPLRDLVQFKDRYVTLYDSVALSRISALLGSRGKAFRVRGGESVSFGDLRDNATVLIGAFNNEWTLKLGGDMRYTFYSDNTGEEGVLDRQHPGKRQWKMVGAWPAWNINEDYAIVSRVFVRDTRRVAVMAAGITQYGTYAAGELITNPTFMKEALAHAPRGWRRMNLQIVIATKVVGKDAGPPRVLATYFW